MIDPLNPSIRHSRLNNTPDLEVIIAENTMCSDFIYCSRCSFEKTQNALQKVIVKMRRKGALLYVCGSIAICFFFQMHRQNYLFSYECGRFDCVGENGCTCVGQTCVCPILEAAIKACCRALFFREQSCCCPSALHSSSSRYWIISGCPRSAAWTRAHWPLLST